MVERTQISIISQLQLLDRLQHLIYLSSSLIFVSGEKGSGKSTLAQLLSNKLPNTIQQVYVQLAESLSDSQIRQQILSQLYEQPLFNPQDDLFTSMSLLQEKHNSDAARLIILDNAHLVSFELLTELLQVISQKEQFGDNEVNILFLADGSSNQQMMSLIKQAEQKQLRKSACLEFKLEPLGRGESTALLNHIFKQFSYKPQIDHQDALLKQLSACSGSPQKIIQLAEEITAGTLENSEPSWLKARLPAVLLMLFMLLIVGGLGTYLYPHFITSTPPAVDFEANIEVESKLLDEITDSGITAGQEVSTPDAEVEVLAGSWSNSEKKQIESSRLQVGDSDQADKRVTISEQQISALPDFKALPSANEQVEITQQKQETKVEQVNEDGYLSRDEQDAGGTELLLSVVTPVEKQQSIISSAAATVTKNGQIEKPLNSEIVIEETIKAKTVPVAVETAPVKVHDAVNKPDYYSVFTARESLFAVKPSLYTLQLSGMSSELTLQRFISKHQLPRENVYLYQTIRNKKPWYVVIFGQYKSLQEARAAGKKLPGSLVNMDSWAKKYQSVQQDLRLNNE
ncbi:AAA family ATPase [Psychromonas aquimarina]|uniref:AAA family ATPase n=1 Tax=Psychromonas aquimarina TaxID=444919 RepID=UPI0004916EA7|nr:AAA family ATPase [Psychromonas aquimarina]